MAVSQILIVASAAGHVGSVTDLSTTGEEEGILTAARYRSPIRRKPHGGHPSSVAFKYHLLSVGQIRRRFYWRCRHPRRYHWAVDRGGVSRRSLTSTPTIPIKSVDCVIELIRAVFRRVIIASSLMLLYGVSMRDGVGALMI